jgi:hypothetical protein
VKQRAGVVLFWALIAIAVLFLVRTTREDWRGSLRIAVFVVPFVLLTGWFESRFKGPKKQMARIMVNSALFAAVAGSLALWDVTLFRSGFQTRYSLMEAIVAGAVFVVSGSVLGWSLLRLLRSANKFPT